MKTGGIVLCGGRSSRMGKPKAWLPFGGEFMLARVVRVLREAVEPVVVVAAPEQDVPPLPSEVRIVRDEIEGRGPLAGLAAGLAALVGTADAVYLSSCDVPLLKPEFVRQVVSLIQDPPPHPPSLQGGGSKANEGSNVSVPPQAKSPLPAGRGAGGVGFFACVPRANEQLHPLAAVYRVSVLPHVRAMLATDRLRLMDLFNAIPTRVIEAEELADIDPRLLSLWNVNTPADYESALRELVASQSG
jgi:molybdopterin-guanine dinucleotide biosynthesis protein A